MVDQVGSFEEPGFYKVVFEGYPSSSSISLREDLRLVTNSGSVAEAKLLIEGGGLRLSLLGFFVSRRLKSALGIQSLPIEIAS